MSRLLYLTKALATLAVVLGSLLVFQACQQQAEVAQEHDPAYLDMVEVAAPPTLADLHALEQDYISIESDIEIIDQWEWHLTQWMSRLDLDAVERECFTQDLQFVNAVLLRCQNRVEKLIEDSQAALLVTEGLMQRVKSIRHRLNSRANSIRSLKEELIQWEFTCDELDGSLDEDELERARLKATGRENHKLKQPRKPTSLYKHLV